MKQTVQARLLGMAESEILDYVPTRIYLDIKKKDPVPTFKAFVVGGEGTWNPTLVGIGAVVMRWFKSAVQKIVALLDTWTPVFHLHAATNEQEGRAVIGRVVGKAEKQIDGVTSAMAIIYILPEYQGMDLDIASIEADVDVVAGAGETPVKDVNVLGISGIALGSSSINKPAFPGATLLASLQAFAGNQRTAGGDEMTLEDLKRAISDGKYRPSDLFDGKALVEDPFIVGHVKEEKTGEYFARKRSETETAEKIKKIEDEKKVLEARVGELTATALKTVSGEAFKAALKEHKLVDEAGKPKDEKLVKFINRNFDKSFKPTDEASLKKDVDKFMDTTVDEFKELFGEAKPGAGEGGGAAGGGHEIPPAGEGAGAGGEDLTDPKFNPLIPQ